MALLPPEYERPFAPPVARRGAQVKCLPLGDDRAAPGAQDGRRPERRTP